ncbi:histidine phosphatase superfamily [Echria macrotheca]|uniref:Histidine phosphatase superfamily n=1 Tax=Echria macrotheca TaxID=438768 RepID=A0AAJ0F1X5_9PEZI|nr:histidine phosphatase superfamily [Echria macrotheca]
MPLETIYVTRHGFRSNWLVDPSSGSYSATIKSPTGRPADPALTAHGVQQARELGHHLLTIDPPIERVYSSLYYRCLQTVEPFVRGRLTDGLKIRGETGIGEWYGAAKFEHPVPAAPDELDSHFPALLDLTYRPAVVPTRMGEGVDELHNRVAATMEALIAECDRDGVKTVLLCSHAAVVIALGRVLTGNMPDNIEVEDFGAFTCGLSRYRRRKAACHGESPSLAVAAYAASDTSAAAIADPGSGWRGGRGVSSGWDCELNSDCSHLSMGEERGWRFSGDESFKDAEAQPSILDSGKLGVVVEGRHKNQEADSGVGDSGGTNAAHGGSRL